MRRGADRAAALPLRVERAGERLLHAENREQRLEGREVAHAGEQRALIREGLHDSRLADDGDLVRGIDLECELFDGGDVVRHLHFGREFLRLEFAELERPAIELHAARERAIHELHRAASIEPAREHLAFRADAECFELRRLDRELRIDRRSRVAPPVLGKAIRAAGGERVFRAANVGGFERDEIVLHRDAEHGGVEMECPKAQLRQLRKHLPVELRERRRVQHLAGAEGDFTGAEREVLVRDPVAVQRERGVEPSVAQRHGAAPVHIAGERIGHHRGERGEVRRGDVQRRVHLAFREVVHGLGQRDLCLDRDGIRASGHVCRLHLRGAIEEGRTEIEGIHLQLAGVDRLDARGEAALPCARLFRLPGEAQREARESRRGRLRRLEVCGGVLQRDAGGIDSERGVVALLQVFALLPELRAGERKLGGAAECAQLEHHAAAIFRAPRGVEVCLLDHQFRRELEVSEVEVAACVARLGGEVFPHGHPGRGEPCDAQVAGLLRVEHEVEPLDARDGLGRGDGEVEVLHTDAVRIRGGLREDVVQVLQDRALPLPVARAFFFSGDCDKLQLRVPHFISAQEFAQPMPHQHRHAVLEPQPLDDDPAHRVRGLADRGDAHAFHRQIRPDATRGAELDAQVLPHGDQPHDPRRAEVE